MMSNRFDFEEQLVRCWCVVDELKDLDEGLFEEWLKFNKDSVSNHILGIANSYDVKFHKLWHLFETEYMETIRKNKMLEEECSALREQLVAETQGYNLGKKPVYDDEFKPFHPKVLQDNENPSPAVIKANKKVKK
jgi:hypothetical protein